MELDPQQVASDTFYWKHGPCCAGCDWWRHITSTAGECTRSAPAPSKERGSMLGIQSASLDVGAGHILTPREHLCGDFADTFDWSSLGPLYLKRIGAAPKCEEDEHDR